jgi:alkylated DNA repair dioxygenase AlkB
LAAFLAEPSVAYRYSGVVHRGQGWPDWFVPLLQQMNERCGVAFNGCLFNHYRDGHDRMGWHADDEPEIDAGQPIASLSLGATRSFQLRRRDGAERHSLELSDGDLLVMTPPCQQQWVHGLPVRKRVTTPRINLTFRVFKTPATPTTKAGR